MNTAAITGDPTMTARTRAKSFLTFAAAGLGIAAIAFAAPAQAALIHNWTFDSGLTDSVGGKNATAFNGAAGGHATNILGGGSAVFDGVNDYMTAGASSDFNIGTGLLSVSFWVNDSSPEGSDRMVATGANNNTTGGWGFDQNTVFNDPRTRMSDGVTRNTQVNSANAAVNAWDGNWHLVAAVFDYNGGSGTITAYLDGVKETAIPHGPWSNGAVNNAFELVIGANPGARTQNLFDGNIDDLAIWDHALTQGQVSQLWNSGTGTAAAEVVLAIPEPSTFVLTVLGLLGMACLGRRRRQRS